MACSGGSKADIFCRECALNDLVAQRKEIARLEREWEEREIERGEEERLAREEEASRELDKFERTAQGLETNPTIFNSSGARKKRKAAELDSAEAPDQRKRKPEDEKVDPLSTRQSEYKIVIENTDVSDLFSRPRLPSGSRV